MNWWGMPCSPYSSPPIQPHSTQPRTRASIQAACSPQPKHPVCLIHDRAQYLLSVLQRPVQRAGVETKHPGSYFIKGKGACALFSRRTGINFFVAVLFFKTSQIFQKKQGREAQTYRGRDQLPPHIPKYHYTSKGRTWKRQAHTQFHPGLSLTTTSTCIWASIHVSLATSKSLSLPLAFIHKKHEPKRYRMKQGQLKWNSLS